MNGLEFGYENELKRQSLLGTDTDRELRRLRNLQDEKRKQAEIRRLQSEVEG